MTKNDLVLLHQSSSPLKYPTQTSLVWFISLFAFHEAGLILFLGTLTLKNVDHVSIMKSNVDPTQRIGGITSQSETKTC